MLGIGTDGHAVTRLAYLPLSERALAPKDAVAEQAVRELERYLADPQYRFSVALAPGGTAFQQRVWNAIATIPPGESRTYGEVARMVRSAPRAVGGACGANRIALVIPCHRVVGAQGSLGGFMGVGRSGQDGHTVSLRAGDPIAIKRWLLHHEGYRFGA
ncbi:MAG: methylated-DNA--[protein]-cysteine S-methyltransferase [Burkholderiales bacterium]|nr:methylated-DNA--[protein]-cysteine S-methyltransferase [Burkholderiales bacterium]